MMPVPLCQGKFYLYLLSYDFIPISYMPNISTITRLV